MRCNNCGKECSRSKTRYTKEGEKKEECERCSQGLFNGVPDVYFRRPYFDEHLADAKNPHGHYIESRRHKAEVLKKLGLFEAGDRMHGGR